MTHHNFFFLAKYFPLPSSEAHNARKGGGAFGELVPIAREKAVKPSLLMVFQRMLPFFALAMLTACANPPDYPVVPHIEFIEMTEDTLRRGAFAADTTEITFSFTDGDGDIGHDDTLDMFVVDTRTGTFEYQYKVPQVPKLGASNGIKGEIKFSLFSTCCIFPPDLGLDPCEGETASFPYDKVVYEIFIKDRAGNQSNVIQADPIFVRCFD